MAKLTHQMPFPEGSDVLVVLDADTPPPLFFGLDKESLSRLIVVVRGAPRGLVSAYNVGFAWFAQGPWQYLHLLEDGVVLTDGYLTAMRRTLDAHPEFGWVACGHESTPFMTLCSLMTRACALSVRGLDFEFAPCQFDDGDLGVRVQLAGFQPHGVAHQVSHPAGRTSVPEAEKQADLDRMHRHHDKFVARWGIPDSPIPNFPVHQPCERCRP